MTRAKGRALPRGSGPALLALAACLVCYAAGWRGTDWAAQLYRVSQDAHHGLVIWDPGWYGGTFPFNYSVVYPPLAAELGVWPLAAISAAGAALCFDRLATAGAGRRPLATWYFAISTVIEVAIGQLPTLTGEALALASVVCLGRYWQKDGAGGPWRGATAAGPALGAAGLGLGLMAALTSPVVGSFLALCLCAWGFSEVGRVAGDHALGQLATGVAIFAAAAAPTLVFPSPGYFPFGPGDLAVVLGICAVLGSPLLHAPRSVQVAAVFYGLVSVGLFVVHTQMGDNDARFGAYIGVPVVVYYLPRAADHLASGPRARWRWPGTVLAGLAAGALVLWHWSPIAEALGGPADGASSVASFYQPLVGELRVLTKGEPARVEIPPTAHHWESVYVAAQFPLARGWERQLDMAYDALFYRSGPVPPGAYLAWLVANGVSYVALPAAPLDYAAAGEAALLRSGRVHGLVRVWDRARWQVWKVTASAGLAAPPARVESVGPGQVVLAFSTGGTSVVKVRWSPFWSVTSRPGGDACVARAAGGWTDVTSAVPGVLDLRISVLGAHHGECSITAGPAGPYDQGVDGR